MSTGGIAAEVLRQGIDRIRRLEEETKALRVDIKDIYDQLGSQGFDKKTCRKVVRRLDIDPDTRREEDALLELYEATLGMNEHSSLSDRTRDHLSKPKDDDHGSESTPNDGDHADPPPDVSLEEARVLGRQAAQDGKPVSANPFPAGDPRRAAWDEEWCRAAGNDGMEIPEQFRRKKKTKKDKDPENDKEGKDD